MPGGAGAAPAPRRGRTRERVSAPWEPGRSRPPRRVVSELGTITAGSPVQGVRLQNPNPTSPIELVLYPSQMDGRRLEVERETFDPA